VGDEAKLARILGQLLGNAVKFTPEGGFVRLNAWINDQDKEQINVGFEIVDSGIGITKEQQEKLFYIFEQGEGVLTRRFSGLGLGLAYCKKLVELMGGQIQVQSEPGQGTKVNFNCQLTKSHKA